MSNLKPGIIFKSRYRVKKQIYDEPLLKVYLVDDIHLKKVWILRQMKILASSKDHFSQIINQFIYIISKYKGLDHQYLSKAIDYFIEQGFLYIVREYIPGSDLKTIIYGKDKEIEEPLVIDWMIQLIDLMLFLQSKKVPENFYKDIIPANILISNTGNIKCIDLGLGFIFPKDMKNAPQTIIWEEYEIPNHDPQKPIEQRALVYIVGCILYNILLKKNPKDIFQKAPSVKLTNPFITREIDRITTKCLEPEIKERYQNLNDLKKELNELLLNKKKEPREQKQVTVKGKKTFWFWIFILLMTLLSTSLITAFFFFFR